LIYQEFINKLNKTDNNIFIIMGSCDYFKKQASDDILKHFSFKTDDLDFENLSEKASEGDIISACDSVSFLGNRRMIYVTDFSGFKSTKSSFDKLNDYIGSMPKSNILIFYSHDKVDKRKKIFKTIKKFGFICEFEELSASMLESWIISEFKKFDKEISKRSANKLVEVCGTEVMFLSNEIAKLSSYCDKQEIDIASIEKIASKSLEYNVFQIHDCFMKKNTNEGLTLLKEIIEKEKSPFGILGLLSSKLRLLYKAKALTDAGVSQNNAIKHIGGHPYAAKIAISECKKFSINELRHAINDLAELDYKLKSGKIDMGLSIENIFLSIYKI